MIPIGHEFVRAVAIQFYSKTLERETRMEKGSGPILFVTVVARMDEHDSYCKKVVFTRRNRYGEAVVLQSPGSRSAPWDRMDNNVYPKGVTQVVYTAKHIPCATPSG